MKIQYRISAFETNSSSTHSLTMCNLTDYSNWKRGDVLYHIPTREFVSIEKAIDINNRILNNYNENTNKKINSFNDLPIIEQMDGAVTALQYEDIAEDQEWNTFVKFLEIGDNTAVSFGYFAVY